MQEENENLVKKTFILRFFENRLLFTKKKCIEIYTIIYIEVKFKNIGVLFRSTFFKRPQIPSFFFTLLLRKSVKTKNKIVSTYKSIPFFLKKIRKRLDKGG